MEKATLKAQKRDCKIGGKNLLRSGIIPAVVYDQGKTETIQVLEKDTRRLFAQGISESRLIDLDIEGKVEQVLVKEYQIHPVKDTLQHLDFFRISQTKKVRTRIAVHLEGKPEGVKNGGILETFLTEVPYEAFARDLTDALKIDITTLQIGEAIHVKDIVLPSESRIMLDPQTVVCLVAQPAKEEEAPAAAATAATPAQGDAQAKAEPAKK